MRGLYERALHSRQSVPSAGWCTMRTRSSARQVQAYAHPALLSLDVLSNTLAYVEVKEGCKFSVAVICKDWRDAWRRRCAGLYRVLRVGAGDFSFADHLGLSCHGVLVADYGHSCLQQMQWDGVEMDVYGGLDTPSAVAPGPGTTVWVVNHDSEGLACLDLEDVDEENRLNQDSPVLWATLEGYAEGTGMEQLLADYRPQDVAAAGGMLLVLCTTGSAFSGGVYGRVAVLGRSTGRVYSVFGTNDDTGATIAIDELRGPSSLAVRDNYCFIADRYNQRIAVFDWQQETFVRSIGRDGTAPILDIGDEAYWDDDYEDERRGTGPGEFDEPYGVAVRGNTLFVSESGGRRIQLLRLPDDLADTSKPVETLQVIPSPDGRELSGLCLEGNPPYDRLWCLGPAMAQGGTTADRRSCVHILGPCV